jgi:tetratricopeptide (TPR) repeat protein
VIVSVTISDSREAEIADAIRSVVGHVDRVLLIDTGITDRTVERAREVAGTKLSVVKHEWVDFSAARNAGLQHAKKLGAEWAIIVDSDERIDFGTLNLRDELSKIQADMVLIWTDDGHAHYPKEKILRTASGAIFVGPTHEVPVGGTHATLQGATFSALPKSQEQLSKKFSRDVVLLSDYVRKHPSDPRWWFYLGLSYEGLGKLESAADAFGECNRRRKFGEEAAWSAFKQAWQFFILERFEEAIAAAARGIGSDATFAECAWIAAVAAMRLNRTDQAIALARMTEAAGRYKGCGRARTYFQHTPALYELPYDVLRYALPEGSERRQAEADFHAAKLARLGTSVERDLERLSITRNVFSRHEARSMLRPPLLSDLCRGTRTQKIRFEPPNGWKTMNPSICWHNGEMWCVVRTVNYSMIGRQYTIHDPEGIVRTENYLGRLDLESGELIDPKLMRDLDASPRQDSKIVGYEDIRLISVEGSEKNTLSGSATVCDRDASRRMIARIHLNSDHDVERAVVQPSNQFHEKNWMPISTEGRIAWIYSLDPTMILPGPTRNCPFALEHLRGGAAIAFEDGYLCVVHEVIETDESRVYLHRFVQLDERFNVIGVSVSWIFDHYGIEFCAGIAQDGDDIVLSYGLDDRESWIARVSAEEIEKMKWMNP